MQPDVHTSSDDGISWQFIPFTKQDTIGIEHGSNNFKFISIIFVEKW